MAMSNEECLSQKLDVLNALQSDALKRPVIPMERFHQEAEYLYKWCLSDKVEFNSVGFDWRMVEDLPIRIGASRKSQEEWMEGRFSDPQAVVEWIQMARIASDFRDRILSACLYAFRRTKEVMPLIREIAKGDEDVTILTDLERLITLARRFSEPLFAIRFHFQVLDDAEFLAEKMVGLLAFASKNSNDEIRRKHLRDAAYTHLKEATLEIRACGLYLFRRNAERARGYGASLFAFGDDRIEDKAIRYRVDSMTALG